MRTTPMAIFAAVSLWLVLAPAATAQQLADLKKTTPEERAAVLTEMMKAKLSLSDSQLSQVRDINLKYAKKMQPILEGSERPLREMWEMKEVNQDKEAELKKVLTPEQFQHYLASKAEMREQFETRMMKKREAKQAGGE